MDKFSENFQMEGGGVIFNSKIYIYLNRFLLSPPHLKSFASCTLLRLLLPCELKCAGASQPKLLCLRRNLKNKVFCLFPASHPESWSKVSIWTIALYLMLHGLHWS